MRKTFAYVGGLRPATRALSATPLGIRSMRPEQLRDAFDSPPHDCALVGPHAFAGDCVIASQAAGQGAATPECAADRPAG